MLISAGISFTFSRRRQCQIRHGDSPITTPPAITLINFPDSFGLKCMTRSAPHFWSGFVERAEGSKASYIARSRSRFFGWTPHASGYSSADEGVRT
jgi:hypothetical protein